MKKLLLATLTACGVWLGAQAQNTTHDYTDDLVVSVDNFSTPPMPTTVSIEFPEEGLINIELKNFTCVGDGRRRPHPRRQHTCQRSPGHATRRLQRFRPETENGYFQRRRPRHPLDVVTLVSEWASH